jgi:hypothetical protein
MIFTTEERNGASANGVRLPTQTEIPAHIRALMNRQGH